MTPIRITAYAVLAATLAASPAFGTEFALPIDCTIGENCWVASYPDWDGGPGAADYTCGEQTYDGHQGTDFALRDLAAMNAGVDVLSPADGRVMRTRDGEPASLSDQHVARARARGRECGNGLVIAHPDGLVTQYCHLKAGSLAVERGQRVQPGTVLGQVGISGVSEFPHLHFQARRDGELIDPFTGTKIPGECGVSGPSMWSDGLDNTLKYRRGQIYNAGFALGRPDLKAIRQGAGTPQSAPCDVPALVTWFESFGARAGDHVYMSLREPDGNTLVTRREELEKTQARIFRFAGKRRTSSCWAPGQYEALLRLTAKTPDGPTLSERRIVLDVAPADH